LKLEYDEKLKIFKYQLNAINILTEDQEKNNELNIIETKKNEFIEKNLSK
jgi:hypothetical protein